MELKNFKKLIQVIDTLRDPKDGCPWDIKQTHQTLTKFLLEETYEFLQAVEEDDYDKMEEEIGDVLLQVLLHAHIGANKKKFTLESLSDRLAKKLIYRHPHIFNNQDGKFDGIETTQIKKNWEQLKKEEKKATRQYEIDEHYLYFPALFSANKIGEKSTKINFDWDNSTQVIAQVEEEWQELKDELTAHHDDYDHKKVEEELGDLLFSMAQLARHLKLDPEQTLRLANKKFIRRFKRVEDYVKKSGKDFSEHSKDEMENFWKKSKKKDAK